MMTSTNPDAAREQRPRGSAVRLVEVPDDFAGQRLDNFLLRELKGVPKSHIYRVLRKGEVRVNKGRAKPEYRLQAGDVVRIPPIVVAEASAPAFIGDELKQRLEASILFEDGDLLVLNKPSGVAVHGGSGVSFGLIEALRQMRPECTGLELVHRLDRDTSGCIVLAKRRPVLRHLHEQLREGGMDKRYLALVVGQWPAHRKEVDAPLKKNELRSGERVVRVDAEGKPSLTEFRVVQRFQGATLVEASPITGRTHQIRVHAQLAGHPLIGDEKYGDEAVNAQMKGLGFKRLFLHACRLSFKLPGSKTERVFEAPLPDDLVQAMKRLPEKK